MPVVGSTVIPSGSAGVTTKSKKYSELGYTSPISTSLNTVIVGLYASSGTTAGSTSMPRSSAPIFHSHS